VIDDGGASILVTAPASAVLRVGDLERAKRFYHEILGLKIHDVPGRAGETQALAGDGTMLCLYERPTMAAPVNTVACFEVPDVPEAVAALRRRGVAFEEYDMPESGLVTLSGVAVLGSERRAWFKDSEGNTLVLREQPL
jgi:catechol 2,3-dioxygenase-like lactoylglutathione lyase family enzyme